jgi:3-dehydroquinate dehydratase, type II
MKILVINGPNLNLTGRRQPEIYGSRTMDDIIATLRHDCPEVTIDYFQSNCEGAIIDRLHEAGFGGEYAGIALNAGAYTHTSLAIADAIAAIGTPVVEIHLSNIAAREEIRHRSLIAPVCRGTIAGFGELSYRLAVEAIKKF